MNDENGYNGWTNYETWLTALWIDNDQGSYVNSREIVRLSLPEDEHEAYSISLVADTLKDWLEETRIPELPASLASDLLSSAFARVNWYEIAENYIEEVVEEERVSQ